MSRLTGPVTSVRPLSTLGAVRQVKERTIGPRVAEDNIENEVAGGTAIDSPQSADHSP